MYRLRIKFLAGDLNEVDYMKQFIIKDLMGDYGFGLLGLVIIWNLVGREKR